MLPVKRVRPEEPPRLAHTADAVLIQSASGTLAGVHAACGDTEGGKVLAVGPQVMGQLHAKACKDRRQMGGDRSGLIRVKMVSGLEHLLEHP